VNVTWFASAGARVQELGYAVARMRLGAVSASHGAARDVVRRGDVTGDTIDRTKRLDALTVSDVLV
jgi:hypothetical protein